MVNVEPDSLGQGTPTSLWWRSSLSSFLKACLIGLVTLAAYSNSFTGPFIFDDYTDIVNNSSIRHLWPIEDVLVIRSSGRTALHGRPVVNLTLALNYAIGGLEPFSYHVTNVLIHLLAGMTLFGIVRRTLVLPSRGQDFAAVATPLALATALLWTLHPLQTAAITCIVQRYESLMGLFYLIAIYAAIRCGTSAHARLWSAATVAASLLAMCCKEVAVSIPLTILLYDRAFMAGSFRAAWSQRRGMYLGQAAAWAAFVLLFLFSYSRKDWAGYDLPVSWIEYVRSQFGVILHYLRLSFWPRPLTLDYGWPMARTTGEILPGLLVIGGLLAATAYALIRWPKWGFLGAWFFLILAPTSSVMPLADLAFEHRMYLPLAAVVTCAVLGGYYAGCWLVSRAVLSRPAAMRAGVFLVTGLATVQGIVTFDRNADYHSDLSIWQDTVGKMPNNCRAHSNLGVALGDRGRFGEAVVHYRRALAINPAYADARTNLGAILAAQGRTDESIAQYRQALAINPDYADAHNNLGIALASQGKVDESIVHYRRAIELKPDYANAYYNLGSLLADCGQREQAIACLEKALKYDPKCAEAHNNLATVLFERERFDEADAHFQKALALKPDYAEAYTNFANALASRGQIDAAIANYRKALKINPTYAPARRNLDAALAQPPQR